MPTRMCLGCREKCDDNDLIRFVASPDGVLVADVARKLPGRGVWVHPMKACVARLSSKSLSRGLNARLQPSDPAQVLREALWRSALDGLSLAAASGSLIGGHDRLRGALEADELRWVWVASDASERTIASLRQANPEARFLVGTLDADLLGRRIGKGARAAIGVVGTRGSAHLRRQLRRLHLLG